MRTFEVIWGPFLERPDSLPGPESDFDIKVSRKVWCVLTSDEVHFVSLADNFTVQLSNFLKLPLEWKTKQLNGPGNYRELRETGPWIGNSDLRSFRSWYIKVTDEFTLVMDSSLPLM